eukprot:m.4859 g.4859  ORF g.4859 m.4859 type:complete len:68 (+) comp11447_c0_seq2:94-297(+)
MSKILFEKFSLSVILFAEADSSVRLIGYCHIHWYLSNSIVILRFDCEEGNARRQEFNSLSLVSTRQA